MSRVERSWSPRHAYQYQQINQPRYEIRSVINACYFRKQPKRKRIYFGIVPASNIFEGFTRQHPCATRNKSVTAWGQIPPRVESPELAPKSPLIQIPDGSESEDLLCVFSDFKTSSLWFLLYFWDIHTHTHHSYGNATACTKPFSRREALSLCIPYRCVISWEKGGHPVQTDFCTQTNWNLCTFPKAINGTFSSIFDLSHVGLCSLFLIFNTKESTWQAQYLCAKSFSRVFFSQVFCLKNNNSLTSLTNRELGTCRTQAHAKRIQVPMVRAQLSSSCPCEQNLGCLACLLIRSSGGTKCLPVTYNSILPSALDLELWFRCAPPEKN